MHNSFIYKIKGFIDKLFQNEYGIIYNSEYSPQMNPIKVSFCKIKNLFRSMEMEGNKKTPSKI